MRYGLYILLLAAGCSDQNTAGKTNIKPCASSVCNVSSSLVLAAEIVPTTSGSGATLPNQEVSELALDAVNGRFTVTLEQPVTISGAVTSGGHGVAATVVATRSSRIAGRPDVYYQTTAAATGSYALVVSPTHPGESYTLSVLPPADSLSPPQAYVVDAGADRTLLITLSKSSELLQIHGVITDALQVPIAGMQVVALDPDTHSTVSSGATTDASGAFSVRLAPPVTAIGNVTAPAELQQVLLVATPPAMMLIPTLSTLVDISKAGPANSLTASLTLPALPTPTQLIYPVQGFGSNGTASAVVSAHCVFSADVSDPKSAVTAHYQAAADTDVDGRATVMLIAAANGNRDYQVTVSPPASSNFQAVATTISVGPSGGYAGALALAQRAQVTGRVLGPDQAPIKNLMVIPTVATVAAAMATPSSTALLPNLASALTDAHGGFVVRVDSGAYDFGLIPLSTSGLPRLWLDGQQISTDTVLPPVQLPDGILVKGQINDVFGAPLLGADIRLYSLVQKNVDCTAGDTTCLAPPRLIADGISIADGSVSVLLPAAPSTSN